MTIIMEHSTAQHSTAQHSTAQHSTAQHSTAQHSTAQHSTAQSVALGAFIALEMWLRLVCLYALQRIEIYQEPEQSKIALIKRLMILN